MSRWRPLRTALLATTAIVPLGLAPAAANPLGPNVVGGAATVSGVGTPTVTVTQTTQNAIINWQQFNIGAGELTKFVQPNASSIMLNRVTGGLGPSTIDGSLTANGRIFIVNPYGLLIGRGAVIDTGGFLATTNDITNRDFMAGRMNFTIPGRPDASIVNQGVITAHSAGFAGLVAPGVRNSGTISATFGRVGLAAANGFTLDLYGDQLITLTVGDSIAATVKDVATGQPLTSLVKNEGTLKANGGRVELTAVSARQVVDSVINNTGVIEARSIGQRQGKIVLGGPTADTKVAGAPAQTVKVSGTLSASGKRKHTRGGTIQITGENIELAAATLDASGRAGGGKVLIGGDVGGGRGNPLVASIPQAGLEAGPVRNATTVSVDSATTINASATGVGDAGKVIVWADHTTTFAGNIKATGGATSGNGGFVEVSGHRLLNFTGSVDLRAPNGSRGTLLLDPADGFIDAVGGPARPPGSTVITNVTVQNQLALGNFIFATDNVSNPAGQNGDITVSANVTWGSGSTLTLSAFRDIRLLDNVKISNTGGGSLVMRADSTATGTGTITFQQFTFGSRVDWTASIGKVSFYYNPPSYTSPTDFTPNGQGGGTRGVTVASADQFTAYMLVNNVIDLQNVTNSRSGQFALGKNIDASSATSFAPIGATTAGFVFDGNGGLGQNYSIDGLTIFSQSPAVGLFSSNAGTIRNVTLTDVVVVGIGTTQSVGALVGQNEGTILNSHVRQGAVSGPDFAGGLVGLNLAAGSIIGSSAVAVDVQATGTAAGGLAATNAGSIVNSIAIANVAGIDADAGGLVGFNTGSIERSVAGGMVTGSNSFAIGGLVGLAGNGSAITDSMSVAAVTGTATFAAGGLVGSNSGTITNSYATGLIAASASGVGGVVGFNQGTVTDSYWDTQTTGLMTSAGGTGLTTAQLQAGLPSGFSSATWGIIPDTSYPYLLWQFPVGQTPQVLSGTAYTDRGVTPDVGATVLGFANGAPLISVVSGPIVTAGANGYYNFLLQPGTIAANTQLGVGTGGHNNTIQGATVRSNASGSTTGLDIYGDYLRLLTDRSTYSATLADVSTSVGGDPMILGLLNALPNREIVASAATFGINLAINTGTLVLASGGEVNQSAPIIATGVALLGGGGQYTLTHVGNDLGALAANAGRIRLSNNGDLEIGTVAGVAGITATDALTLNVAGTIMVSGPVTTGTFTLTSGDWVQNAASLPAFYADDFRIAGGSFLRVTGGDGTSGSPYSIADSFGLQGLGSVGLDKHYVLASNIDLGPAAAWNSGAGFVPIGGIGGTFTGVFDGQGHTIANLTQSGNNSPLGLFPFVGAGGEVKNLNLSNVNITSTGDLMIVGTLVGENFGTISNATVSGSVSAGSHTAIIAGGLVGQNSGTVTGSTSSVVVTVGDGASDSAFNYAGGLVGVNQGAITNSSASGNVTAGASGFSATGGLVGLNLGSIAQSHATGAVSGGQMTGGLAGLNLGSIDASHATGAVAGVFVAGGLVGMNFGEITGSHATGAVTASGSGFPHALGGLVGQNANVIESSFATGDVTSASMMAMLGGLVGSNLPGATISVSYATGNVTSTADLSTVGGGSCDLNPVGCQFVAAGGLVGQNLGTIVGPGGVNQGGGAGTPNETQSCVMGQTCATGAVTVGSLGIAGGLVGTNSGFVVKTFATGNVIGGPGIAPLADSDHLDQTTLGGLVGFNTGVIDQSRARGNVGTHGVNYLQAGGLVGDNAGTITASSATGNVIAGNFSTAGGLVGNNSVFEFACDSCFIGDGYNNNAAIGGSSASGNVTVGSSSIAGGLVGFNNGTLVEVAATGNVTGGDNSFLGGLVGVAILPGDDDSGVAASGSGSGSGGPSKFLGLPPGSINVASASGAVTGTGESSVVGGLVGLSTVEISNSSASGAVVGTSDSFLGGFFGVNLGLISESRTLAGSSATGTGANNVVGGFGGANFGLVIDSTSVGNASSGANSVVGGFVGANARYTNEEFLGVVPGATTFPVGAIVDSTATGTAAGGSGSTVGAQVGVTNPSTLTAYPSIVQDCGGQVCEILRTGTLPLPSDDPHTPDIPPEVALVINMILSMPPPQQDGAPATLIALTTPTDAAGPSPGGPGGPGQPGTQRTGRGVTGLQVFAPPPVLRPVAGPDGERFSGIPPLTETRFRGNEVLVQIRSDVPQSEINRMAQLLGLTVLSETSLGSVGRNAIRFSIPAGLSVREVIRRVERNPNFSVQPNYTYTLTQQNGTPRGDPSQYVIEKFKLEGTHKLASGSNVTVAVVDSLVDNSHSELAGTISERYDAVGVSEDAHSHGTAMAGAIVSRDRLLGVAPNARIVAVRSFAQSAATAEGTTFNIIRGIEWAMNHGVRVINMSFAGPYDPSLERVLKAARDKGVILVAAAGNAGPKSPPLFPGADVNVIGVTATDSNDRLFRGANQGGYVSVAAPGVEILAPAPQAAYQMSTGTSIATAHVSGVIALMLERDPTLTPADVKRILETTATDLGPKGRDNQFGWGLVNPEKALAAVDARKKNPVAAPAAPAPARR